MNEGRWVTISGRRVFIKPNQHPMDAYIRNQESDYENFKTILGDYGKQLQRSDYVYKNNQLYRRSKIGLQKDDMKVLRNVKDYKIYGVHFDTALPYTHYWFVNTKTNEVFEIPEIITDWHSGALKEMVENIQNGGPKQEYVYDTDFDPLEWVKGI